MTDPSPTLKADSQARASTTGDLPADADPSPTLKADSQAARVQAKPFLKWAGGKRELLPVLLSKVPPDFSGTYHEPFVGGGAMFFALAPEKAYLSDLNTRLVRAYKGVQGRVDDVISLLRSFPGVAASTRQAPGQDGAVPASTWQDWAVPASSGQDGAASVKTFFHALRSMPIDEGTQDFEVAAWLIYLNQMGFNGLYRVNKKGGFNAPFGDKDGFTLDEDRLIACSAALQDAQIQSRSFEKVLYFARRGDLVYFDPPYVDTFTGYTDEGFDLAAQESLRDVARILKRLGVYVIVSNSDNDTVRRLYEGFDIEAVKCTRRISGDLKGRGSVGEVVIT